MRSVGKNILLMRKVKGEWPDLLKLTGRPEVKKKRVQYNSGVKKGVSAHITRLSLQIVMHREANSGQYR